MMMWMMLDDEWMMLDDVVDDVEDDIMGYTDRLIFAL